jgi:uncharacterized protein
MSDLEHSIPSRIQDKLPPHLQRLPQVRLDHDLWVGVASTDWRARLRGLMWVASLPNEWGLLITNCSSVHTFWMRFKLDLVWLDRNGMVVTIDRGVGPRRVVGHRGVKSCLEVVAGNGEQFASRIARGT